MGRYEVSFSVMGRGHPRERPACLTFHIHRVTRLELMNVDKFKLFSVGLSLSLSLCMRACSPMCGPLILGPR